MKTAKPAKNASKSKKPGRAKGTTNKTLLTPLLLVNIYRYARSGLSNDSIADAVNVGQSTLALWISQNEQVVEALKLARSDTGDGQTWHKFVYERLSPDIKALWDKIETWDAWDLQNNKPKYPNAVALIEKLLTDHGKRARQQLFLHALIQCNFSQSRAMHKVNIDKKTLEWWISKEPEFAELVEEMQWHKKNFFEECLIHQVGMGEVSAIIHANKTVNKDRGYGTTSEVNVKHSGQITHSIDLDSLDLAIEVRSAIMYAIQQKEEQADYERKLAAMPVEVRVLEDLSDEIAVAALDE